MADDIRLGNYESAAGWQPRDPYKKQREKARRELKDLVPQLDTMLESRPASQWAESSSPDRVRWSDELFGTFWRRGELAILFGEHGMGKSLLAVQIAEQVARGIPCSPPYEGGVRPKGGVVLS